jgi:hypothetical protein
MVRVAVACLGAVLGLGLFSPISAEDGFSWSGLSFFRTDLPGDGGSATGGSAVIQPAVEFREPSFALRLEPRLSLVSGDVPEFDFASAFAEAHAGDRLTVRAGRMSARAGNALLLSSIDWFCPPLSPESVFNGADVSSIPEDLAEIAIRKGFWHGTLLYAPFHPVWREEKYAAPFYPVKDVSKPVVDVITEEALPLTGVYADDEYASRRYGADPSFGGSVGFTGENLDASLFAFYGIDRAPARLYRLMYSVQGGYYLNENYDANRIIGSGAAVSWQTDSSEIRLEAAWSGNRLVAQGAARDNPGEWQTAERVNVFSYTAGCTVRPEIRFLEIVGLSVGAEWKNSSYLSGTGNLDYPFLHRALYGFIESRPGAAPIVARLEYVGSLSDGSAAVTPSIVFNADRGRSFRLAAALPVGAEATEIGQFMAGKKIFVSFTAAY